MRARGRRRRRYRCPARERRNHLNSGPTTLQLAAPLGPRFAPRYLSRLPEAYVAPTAATEGKNEQPQVERRSVMSRARDSLPEGTQRSEGEKLAKPTQSMGKFLPFCFVEFIFCRRCTTVLKMTTKLDDGDITNDNKTLTFT